MSETNRQVVLVRRPDGALSADDFELRESEVPTTGDGQVRCRTRLISIDAANRAWLQGATYRAAVEPGQVMAGYALGEVVESRADGFAPGDLVLADGGWQDQFVVGARHAMPVQRREPLTHLLSVYGVAGQTAWVGLFEIGRPAEGETVVVSAAAGSVGSVVGQLARIAGCRVVGIAGTPDKCRWLVDDLGFDAAIDYREQDVRRAVREACPDGVDVYFDNVGGPILEAVLPSMNLHGRIVCCGAVSGYDQDEVPPGPRGIPGVVVVKRLRMEGFIIMDHAASLPRAVGELAGWVADGRLVVAEDVVEGLERAPEALIGLLAGDNVGKRMVRVS